MCTKCLFEKHDDSFQVQNTKSDGLYENPNRNLYINVNAEVDRDSNLYVNALGVEDDVYEGVQQDTNYPQRIGSESDEASKYAKVDFDRRPLSKGEFEKLAKQSDYQEV